MKLLIVALLASMASPAQAQTIYKWVDDKGRVQYSEKPPAGAKSSAVEQRIPAVGSQARSEKNPQPQGAKPAATAQRPAVTMYMTDWCPYCRQASEYFRRNRIPFVEHDIEKNANANAEYKAKGGRGVPLILVGEQRMSGFSEDRMTQMLKAAGY
jgi:glutaredoxin